METDEEFDDGGTPMWRERQRQEALLLPAVPAPRTHIRQAVPQPWIRRTRVWRRFQRMSLPQAFLLPFRVTWYVALVMFFVIAAYVAFTLA